MPTKKLIGAAAFSAAIATGGIAGAIFGTPTLLSAQETTNETSTEAAPEDRHRGGPKGESLSAAAEALSMTPAQLRAELAAGKSIADVAAEKGVDKQVVIDALVADANARIDEMQTQLPQRMAELVERDGLGRGGDRGPDKGHASRDRGAGIVNSIDDAATALGVARQELRTELQAGKSIATVAEEQGKDLADVKAAMVADANARIDQAVVDGKIDQTRATELKSNLAARVDHLVEREGVPARGGHSSQDA